MTTFVGNSLAAACDVFDGVFFVLFLFPRDVLDAIWDLIESVSEGFSFLLSLMVFEFPQLHI